MNKTEKILACVGHVQTKSIHKVVGCTKQLIYNVLKHQNLNGGYKPKYKLVVPTKRNGLFENAKFSKGMDVLIFGDDKQWTISFIGGEVLCLVRGFDKKSVTKDKITKIVL